MSGWAILVDATETHLADVGAAASIGALAEFAIVDEAITDRASAAVVDFARSRSAELVGMRYNDAGILVESSRAKMAITESTRDFLRDRIRDAVDRGASRDQLAKQILTHPEGFSKARAKAIAQTEMSFANANANFDSWEASGVVSGKTWNLSNQHHQKVPLGDLCTLNAAQGEVPLKTPFQSGHQMDPGHPSCECTVPA